MLLQQAQPRPQQGARVLEFAPLAALLGDRDKRLRDKVLVALRAEQAAHFAFVGAADPRAGAARS